jgi:peptidoglycan/LPS O-acetylase OafA/YrhL
MQVGPPIYAHFVFLQNMLIIPFTGLAGAWFAHLWSLAVEEQFYLISPLVVRLVSPRSLTVVLMCVIGTAPLLRIFLLAQHVDAGLVSSMTPCRADSLAIGMLAAVLWRREGFRPWLEAHCALLYRILGVLFAGVVALWKWCPESRTYGMESIGFTWLAAFFVVVLLLVLIRREGPLARLARMGWLRELGRVSYCAYIIHLVVNVICHSFLRHAPPATTDWRGALVTIFAAFATYAIAWISWKVLEGPLLKIGHSFKYQPAGGIMTGVGSR